MAMVVLVVLSLACARLLVLGPSKAVSAKGKWLAMTMAMVVPAQGNNFIGWWRLGEWEGSHSTLCGRVDVEIVHPETATAVENLFNAEPEMACPKPGSILEMSVGGLQWRAKPVDLATYRANVPGGDFEGNALQEAHGFYRF